MDGKDMVNFAKTVPLWMDHSFFEKVIKFMESDVQAKVLDFVVTAGSKPGDNFASSVFRGVITFKSKFTKSEAKIISLIIKTQLMRDASSVFPDLMKGAPLFRIETDMYCNVLPEIKKLWELAGYEDILCPKFIYGTNEPVPIVILEDVSGQGFGVIEKPPEDLETSKQIFRRLAKFHAATFYLHHEKKLDYSDFTTNLFQYDVVCDMVFDQGLEAFIDVMKEWEGFEKFVPNMEDFKKQYSSKALKMYSPNRNEFGYNVLNHADFHLRNLLFKTNDAGKVDDFYFIDYQISTYATPAIDLIYALYFSVSTLNRQNHRDEIIVAYYHQFAEALKKFGYLKEPPSLIDLHVELLRNGSLEVLLAICFMVMFFLDFADFTPEDMDMGEGSKKAKRRLCRAPAFKEMIEKEMPRFLHNGFI